MSNCNFIITFLDHYLSEALHSQIDFKTIQVLHLMREHVHRSIKKDQKTKSEIADIFCQVKYKHQQGEALILLHVEHFTTAPRLAALRMMNYPFNGFA